MRKVIMIGPQGSGKGTQSELLGLKLDIPRVSIGTLLRAQAEVHSPFGEEVRRVLESGEMVSDELTDTLLFGRLSKPDAANGIVLDGFPRRLSQADALDNMLAGLGRKLTHVLYLKVPEAESLRRLSGRRVCTNNACEKNYHVEFNPPKGAPDRCDACGSPLSQRSDDVPEAIARRLEIYRMDTVPLIELYKGLGLLHEIDGTRPIGEVQAAICQAVGV